MPDADPIYRPDEIAELLTQVGFTHVIWIPDSTTGRWESALDQQAAWRLLRICREGEAWPLAAGLYLGSQRPLVIMQSTGLFESGDALRNVVWDLQLPVWAVIGARNWLTPDSRDSARQFLEPILNAWRIDYRVIERRQQQTEAAAYFQSAVTAGRSQVLVLAEGRG